MDNNFKLEKINPNKSRTCVYDLHYHLVWVTKYRCKAFNDPKIIDALKQRLLFIAKQNDVDIEAMEVMPNHVHLLISAKPKYNITTIIRNFKGNTGRWLFENYPIMRTYFHHNHIWSHSYYVGSVGNTNKDIVEHYINSQRERDSK
jgi:putative transposase